MPRRPLCRQSDPVSRIFDCLERVKKYRGICCLSNPLCWPSWKTGSGSRRAWSVASFVLRGYFFVFRPSIIQAFFSFATFPSFLLRFLLTWLCFLLPITVSILSIAVPFLSPVQFLRIFLPIFFYTKGNRWRAKSRCVFTAVFLLFTLVFTFLFNVKMIIKKTIVRYACIKDFYFWIITDFGLAMVIISFTPLLLWLVDYSCSLFDFVQYPGFFWYI